MPNAIAPPHDTRADGSTHAMGIRGLAHHLQPHRVVINFPEANECLPDRDDGKRNLEDAKKTATTRSCSPSTSSVKRDYVVVDGPALAYHAYYAALSHRRHARTALDAMPKYGEVNDAAIEMLDTLQKHGLAISAIFFDGALPEIKRDVRMHRLEQYMQQMQKYRSLHAAPLTGAGDTCMNYGQDADAIANRNVFNSMLQVPAKLKTLPASPFLVASVIEALQASASYGHLTSVVPGEADYFCAAYARQHGGMILTSDSDLLAYDIGSKNSVAFLRDIEMHAAESETRLRIARYETDNIAKELGLESLLAFAFAVQEDPHKTSKQYLARASDMENSPDLAYLEFAAQYSADKLIASLPDITALASSTVGRIDPRTAEWVHGGFSGPSDASLSNVVAEAARSNVSRMYLPVLIEDTTRASPWHASIDLRVLAYSVVRPSGLGQPSTMEITRRGDRIAEAKVEHFSEHELGLALGSLNGLVDQLSADGLSDSTRWSILALHLLCKYLLREEKPLPTRTMLKALLVRRLNSQWDSVQWTAQMQGITYSLRMIHQCLKVAKTAIHPAAKWTTAHERCLERLQSLPAIPRWFDEDLSKGDELLNGAVDRLYVSLGIDEATFRPVMLSTSSRKKKKRRQKEERKEKDSAPRIPVASSNMFSLLLNG